MGAAPGLAAAAVGLFPASWGSRWARFGSRYIVTPGVSAGLGRDSCCLGLRCPGGWRFGCCLRSVSGSPGVLLVPFFGGRLVVTPGVSPGSGSGCCRFRVVFRCVCCSFRFCLCFLFCLGGCCSWLGWWCWGPWLGPLAFSWAGSGVLSPLPWSFGWFLGVVPRASSGRCGLGLAASWLCCLLVPLGALLWVWLVRNAYCSIAAELIA